MAPPNEEPTDVTGAFSALTAAFSLNRRQAALALRVAWVVGVSATLYYLLFGFAILGITAPHASVADVRAVVTDVQAVKQDIAALKQTSAISARAGLAAEIRAQMQAWCSVRGNASVQETIRRVIDQRQEEFAQLNGGNRYPEPGCGS